MSGHSKWATIKHKKGAADKARGKLFNKIARQLEVGHDLREEVLSGHAREDGADVGRLGQREQAQERRFPKSVLLRLHERKQRRG